MTTLNEIAINQSSGAIARLQLLIGDLTAIPPEHRVDILVTSAFPNDYTPLPGSLFYAFEQKGLSVNELASHKAMDMRSTLSCWLSDRLSPDNEKRFNFKQLLCLEPVNNSTNPVEIVGNLFRSLNNFAFDEDHNSIAMPIVASGRQQVAVDKMLPAVLDNAIFWLKQGVPLECIKIVIHDETHLQAAQQIFDHYKSLLKEKIVRKVMSSGPGKAPSATKTTTAKPAMQRNSFKAGNEIAAGAIAPPPAAMPEQLSAAIDAIDIFISYAHKQQAPVQHFVTALQRAKSGLNIFYDRDSIQGGQWLRLISDAIAKSKKVIVFLSPDYSKSPVCWDEYQCAKVIEYNKGERLIQTIYLTQDDKLPPIMAINSYIDCRDCDLEKLAAACASVI